jgi:transcriptional regulator with XRE-family HTH domain
MRNDGGGDSHGTMTTDRAHVMRTGNPAAVGAMLRSERLAAGLSMGRLARRSTIPSPTISRLERGLFRARRTTLSALALGIDPDRQREILAVLVDAAGGDEALAPDGRWSRYRRHRIEAGMLAGDVPLPSKLARSLALHREADALAGQADAIFHRPGALNDNAALDEMIRLNAQVRQLREQAGPPITFRIGKHEIRAGYAV